MNAEPEKFLLDCKKKQKKKFKIIRINIAFNGVEIRVGFMKMIVFPEENSLL